MQLTASTSEQAREARLEYVLVRTVGLLGNLTQHGLVASEWQSQAKEVQALAMNALAHDIFGIGVAEVAKELEGKRTSDTMHEAEYSTVAAQLLW